MLAIWWRSRRGVTLIELMVALTFIALTASVVGLTLRDIHVPVESSILSRLSAAQRDALRSASPVTIRDTLNGRVVFATAMPDGRTYIDSALRALRVELTARSDR
jgi:prepilin-type N-terminal cleavage/methylation domain-containing protein